MCVIVQGNKKLFNKELLKKAFSRNPDGFGLMYISKSGKLVSEKFYTKRFNKIYKTIFEKHFNKIHSTMAVHFRYTTAGTTNNFNCHPFKVLSTEQGDPFNVSLMHNSPTITSLETDKNKSDTWNFVNYYLKPILKKNPSLLFNESFIDDLEKIVNIHCDTRVLILNDKDKLNYFLGNWKPYKHLRVSNSLFDFSYSSKTFNSNQYYIPAPEDYTSYQDVIEFNQNKQENLEEYLKETNPTYSDLKPYGNN